MVVEITGSVDRSVNALLFCPTAEVEAGGALPSPKMDVYSCLVEISTSGESPLSCAETLAMVAFALAAAWRGVVPFFWGVGRAACLEGRLEGVSSRSVQSSVSVGSESDEERLMVSSARDLLRDVLFVAGVVVRLVMGLVGVVREWEGRERQEATSPPEEAVARSCSASFLMVRNWNWIPSAVDWPKYLAMSGVVSVWVGRVLSR